MDPATDPASVTELLTGDEHVTTEDEVHGVPDAFTEPLLDGEDPATALDTEGV